MSEKKNHRKIKVLFDNKERMHDGNKCIYWRQKKRDETGRYYCLWDGNYYYLEECGKCENYKENN